MTDYLTLPTTDFHKIQFSFVTYTHDFAGRAHVWAARKVTAGNGNAKINNGSAHRRALTVQWIVRQRHQMFITHHYTVLQLSAEIWRVP